MSKISDFASYDSIDELNISDQDWVEIDLAGRYTASDRQRAELKSWLIEYENEEIRQEKAPSFTEVRDLLTPIEATALEYTHALDGLEKRPVRQHASEPEQERAAKIRELASRAIGRAARKLAREQSESVFDQKQTYNDAIAAAR